MWSYCGISVGKHDNICLVCLPKPKPRGVVDDLYLPCFIADLATLQAAKSLSREVFTSKKCKTKKKTKPIIVSLNVIPHFHLAWHFKCRLENGKNPKRGTKESWRLCRSQFEC